MCGSLPAETLHTSSGTPPEGVWKGSRLQSGRAETAGRTSRKIQAHASRVFRSHVSPVGWRSTLLTAPSGRRGFQEIGDNTSRRTLTLRLIFDRDERDLAGPRAHQGEIYVLPGQPDFSLMILGGQPKITNSNTSTERPKTNCDQVSRPTQGNTTG